MKSLISLVIPCYNEEANITYVVKAAHRALNYLCRQFEIIIVDDGSKDNTYPVLKILQEEFPMLKIIQHQENKGYGAAVTAGLMAAQGDYVLMVDGDGQFDLREFSYFFKGLKYADIVIGYRRKRKDPFMRLINAFIFNWAVRICFGLWVKDVNCAMKGFTKEAVKKMDIIVTGALVNVDILTQSMRRGFSVVQTPVHHFPRKAGKPTGAAKKVIGWSLVEFMRLFIREFPLRYKEFSFRQRTSMGLAFAVVLLLFSKPLFGWYFVVGFLIAATGLALRTWAGGHVSKGKELCCSGPYAYIRHPLYVGSLLIGIGFCLMVSNTGHMIITGLLWILLIVFFIGVYAPKVNDEERNLKRLFQSEYTDYSKTVPKFFPYKGRYNSKHKAFEYTYWIKNKEYNSIIGFIIAFVWILIKMSK